MHQTNGSADRQALKTGGQSPADGLLVPGAVRVEDTLGGGNVAAILRCRSVGLEPKIVVVVLVGVGHHNRLVRRIVVGDGGVKAHFATLLVVDGADLEALLGAADDARVALAIAGGAGHGKINESRRDGHGPWGQRSMAVGMGARGDTHLRKHARATVVAARERDRVLIVVREMEVAREPRLDGRVLTDNLKGRGATEFAGARKRQEQWSRAPISGDSRPSVSGDSRPSVSGDSRP
eukprot:scaffold50408_cov28-Tisochrysis_lutea.AAC.2